MCGEAVLKTKAQLETSESDGGGTDDNQRHILQDFGKNAICDLDGGDKSAAAFQKAELQACSKQINSDISGDSPHDNPCLDHRKGGDNPRSSTTAALPDQIWWRSKTQKMGKL